MLTEAQIKEAFRWGEPRIVTVRRGTPLERQRMVLEAPATKEARAFAAANKADCITWQIGLTEYPPESNKWRFTWWRDVPKDVQEAKAKAVAESRATDGDAVIPVPAGLALRGYQTAGVAFALKRNGTLIADEMGLGKTVQIIGVINADERNHRCLIVCPSGLVNNWYSELATWLTREDKDIGIADGDCFPSSTIVICGWGMVSKYAERIGGLHWDLVAIDECHMLKNKDALRSRAILGYRPKRNEPAALARAPLRPRIRLAASGTPALNKPQELWTVLHWLDPINWNDWWRFNQRYCGAYQGRYGIAYGEPTNLKELEEKLRSTVMVRRLKSQVLTELPPKTRQLIELQTDGTEARNERRMMRERGIDIEGALARMEADVVLASAGDSPQTFETAVEALEKGVVTEFESASAVRMATGLAKVGPALEFIRNELEELPKVVVWAHHVEVLELLVEGLKEYGCVGRWGKHSATERQNAVNQFQNDPRLRVFVVGNRAMGTGFTMTAADTSIHVEDDWVPGIILQAEDRIHRIGQRAACFHKHLVLPGTIDAAVLRSVLTKVGWLGQMLDGIKPGSDEAVFFDSEQRAPRICRGYIAPSRREIVEGAAGMSPQGVAGTTEALRRLAAAVGGFACNQVDAHVIKGLSVKLMLSPKEAFLARKLCTKYAGQLPDVIVERMKL